MSGHSSPQKKVFIATPTMGLLNWRWVAGYIELLFKNRGTSLYGLEHLYGVAETRERFVEQMLQMEDAGVTHIFFLDDDVIPPADAIQQLMAYDKPIVSGLYLNSFRTGLNFWMDFRNPKPFPDSDEKLKEMPEIFEASKIGLGLCLIKRELFEDPHIREDRPWFYYKAVGEAPQSEDFYFCQKLLKNNIKPWVAKNVRGLHLKTLPLRVGGDSN